jgi:uncharacterized paraquat-inducible protein A
MAVGVPVAARLQCPRCHFPGSFINIDGGTAYRCSRCEWRFTLSTQAPTGTATNALAQGGTALTVASGGASFTNGMFLLFDTGANAEPLVVNGVSTATNVPVTAAVKAHSSNATFGQLLISSAFSGLGMATVPPVSPYLSGG